MQMFIEVTEFKTSGKYYQTLNVSIEPASDSWYDIVEATRIVHNTMYDKTWLIGMECKINDAYPVLFTSKQ